MDDAVLEDVALDAVVTLIDSKHIEQHLDDIRYYGINSQAVDQIVSADRIIVNKVDLVDQDTVERNERRIRKLNQRSEIDRSSYAEVNLTPSWASRRSRSHSAPLPSPRSWRTTTCTAITPTWRTCSVRIGGELDHQMVEAAAREIAADYGADLLRWKGVLAIAGNDRRVALQGVHRIFEIHDLDRWESPHRDSRAVFIGNNLDRDQLARRLQRCAVDSRHEVHVS